jgi:hypothetical protein
MIDEALSRILPLACEKKSHALWRDSVRAQRPMKAPERHALDARDRALPLTIATLALAIAVWAMWAHPANVFDARSFLFRDEGLSVLWGSKVARGEMPFRDFGYLYGPIPVFLLGLGARLFGGTPQMFIGLLACLSAIGAGLVAALVRRSASFGATLAVVVLAVLPEFVTPGGAFAAFTGSPTLPLERIVLVSVALAWRPPEERTWRRGAAIGALLGVAQAVKFGGAIFDGAALVLLDLLVIALRRGGLPRGWIRSLLAMAAAAAAVMAAHAAFAFAIMPRDRAIDHLWPAYVLSQWAAFVPAPAAGWKFILSVELTPIVGGCLSLAAVALLVRDALVGAAGGISREAAGKLGVLLPVILFFVSWLGFVHIVYHLHGIAWAATLGAGLALDRLPRAPRVVATALLAPMAIALLRGQILRTDRGGARIERAGHGWIVADARTLDDVNALLAALGPELGDGREMFSGPEGAAFEGFFDLPHAGHADLYTPAMVRPSDEDDLTASAPHLGAAFVEVFSPPRTPPRDVCDVLNHVYLAPVLHDGACRALAAQLGTPEHVGASMWIARRKR